MDQRGSAQRELFGEYCQDHIPVREQGVATGHAVRATYQYCAMTDLAAADGDDAMWRALDALWRDVTERKMYLTGGIGNSADNEGFTEPYVLPNASAYCETCASVGTALWAHRMTLSTGEARFADVLERELYNNVPSGVSLSGDRFFYVNPLASGGAHHRAPWFGTSCCPTNIVRFLPAIGERVYASGPSGLYVLLYAQSTATLEHDGEQVGVGSHLQDAEVGQEDDADDLRVLEDGRRLD